MLFTELLVFLKVTGMSRSVIDSAKLVSQLQLNEVVFESEGFRQHRSPELRIQAVNSAQPFTSPPRRSSGGVCGDYGQREVCSGLRR